MRTRQGIIQIHCNTDTVLTHTVSRHHVVPSLPTATCMTQHVLLKLPWCPADGYRSHSTTNLASPHECRQHTNGTTQRACRWKRTIRITTHPPAHNVLSHAHKSTITAETHETRVMEIQTLRTNTSGLPPTFPHCSHAPRTSTDSTLEFQTSQLPNMVALPCTCHTCTYCAHAFMNVKTACVTSIKSLSHLANGSSLLRSVRRSVRLKCENE